MLGTLFYRFIGENLCDYLNVQEGEDLDSVEFIARIGRIMACESELREQIDATVTDLEG